MECPICKNKIGFAFGTCIECGYNQYTNEYDKITVYTEDLKPYVSEEVYNMLIKEHEKRIKFLKTT